LDVSTREATLSPDGLEPPEVCTVGEAYGGVGAITAFRIVAGMWMRRGSIGPFVAIVHIMGGWLTWKTAGASAKLTSVGSGMIRI
jgi:hypothetical protein